MSDSMTLGEAIQWEANYEIGKTAADVIRCLQAAAQDEKRRRVYYQDIVYTVCTHLDKKGGGMIQCGTIEHPTTQVQDAVASLCGDSA